MTLSAKSSRVTRGRIAPVDLSILSALARFAQSGYRKTSMEDVARAARISRPGLYFLFTSKEALFREAVTRALEGDIAEVERILADPDISLRERLLTSFDQWAGRYVGPLARDVAVVIEDNPDLLGNIIEAAPRRFEELVTDAICAASGPELAPRLTQTIISTSLGIKHQVASRETYLERLEVASHLFVR